ncbi:MAG TPA: hypothetical protein VHR88_08160 [Solirubrobacteraceae bacterium]|nr:hypothetical protein [Solirubrobacteraceae bacterium]
MAQEGIDPGALLARTYPIPGGYRVRLRLLRRSDLPALRALLPDELELQRLVRFDPRQRVAIAAASPRARGEALLGAGAIDLVAGAEPDPLVLDATSDPAVAELLDTALRARARRRAA